MRMLLLLGVLSAPPTEQDLMIAELYETDPVLAVEVMDVVDALTDVDPDYKRPEAAYVTLLDMGFSDRDAYDFITLLPDGKVMILGVLTESEGGGSD